MEFNPEQLNFFKFSSVVLDEFPVILRQVFVYMWDTLVASPPGAPKWDDSVTVLNNFLGREGGAKKVPMLNKSSKEWDCTALFKATLFAQTFAKPDGTGGMSTLDKLYVKPRALPPGTFHWSVISPIGDSAETYTLALDQLRLLRNTLCHQVTTRKIDKATFDNYIVLAKDAFTALGQSTTKLDEIGNMGEEEFPTTRLQKLEDELKKEKDAAIKFELIDEHLNKIDSNVENVRAEVTDVKTRVHDVGLDMKELKLEIQDVGRRMENNASDMKTEVTGVMTRVGDVGSEINDVKTRVEAVWSDIKNLEAPVGNVRAEMKDVKTQVEDVGSNVKDMKTRVEDVNSEVKDLSKEVKVLKTEFVDMKQEMQGECSRGQFLPESCVPDKIPHFVGREAECNAIVDHLTNGTTRLVDVWGSPGFGKTSVAINVAHYLREMKHIPVYFTSLRGMESKDDLVSRLLCIFSDANQVPHISPADCLFRCLRRFQDPFVLILDNADDLLESGDVTIKDRVMTFITEIVAQCNHLKLIITSRESLDSLNLKLPMHQEKICGLDEIASGALVRLLIPNVSDGDCNGVVKVCERVPLAIRLMCITMTEENVSVSEFLKELEVSPLVEVLDNEHYSDDARLKVIIEKSLKRLTPIEKDAFVSLAVFPSYFTLKEALEVLDLPTEMKAKRVFRSLERKALIDSTDSFSRFTMHSILRSFVEEQRTHRREIDTVFSATQFRFYDYYISLFGIANEKFLTGNSSEAFEDFFDRRESIMLSLTNGTTEDKLYSKVVDILSKSELFLYGLLTEDKCNFCNLYNSALMEARKRQNVDDECKLLGAKAFGYWGWFSSEQNPDQTWEDTLQELCIRTDCPMKLRCYQGVHQALCGFVDEGISLLTECVFLLGDGCDEEVLKQLVYGVLSELHSKRQDTGMKSYYDYLASSSGFNTKSGILCLGDLLDDTSVNFTFLHHFPFIVVLVRLLFFFDDEIRQLRTPIESEIFLIENHMTKVIDSLSKEEQLSRDVSRFIHLFQEAPELLRFLSKF